MSAVEPGYDVRERYMTTTAAREMFDTFCGEFIGSGMSRAVYVYAMNPAYVVKFECKAQQFQNVFEWDLWTQSHASSKQWLAECREISPNGFMLIQRRAEPVPKEFRWPRHIPSWVCDYKPENFGLVDGRLVCFDYGTNDAQYHWLKNRKPPMISSSGLRKRVEPWLR